MRNLIIAILLGAGLASLPNPVQADPLRSGVVLTEWGYHCGWHCRERRREIHREHRRERWEHRRENWYDRRN